MNSSILSPKKHAGSRRRRKIYSTKAPTTTTAVQFCINFFDCFALFKEKLNSAKVSYALKYSSSSEIKFLLSTVSWEWRRALNTKKKARIAQKLVENFRFIYFNLSLLIFCEFPDSSVEDKWLTSLLLGNILAALSLQINVNNLITLWLLSPIATNFRHASLQLFSSPAN